MLIAQPPFATVLPSIGPSKYAVAMLQVIAILPIIDAPVRPAEHSMTFHPILVPLPFERSVVCPSVRTFTRDVVVYELAAIPRLISPREAAMAVFLASVVPTYVLGTVSPFLYAFAGLLVKLPLPNVLRAVSMKVCSMPVGLICLPLAVIGVAIRMYESALPVRLVTEPLTFVLRTIWPLLSTMSCSPWAVPTTNIRCTIVEGVHLPLLIGLFSKRQCHNGDVRCFAVISWALTWLA
mmetsp:Transcript_37514/g.84534  ORF Transcript_37514/g.84534 Transcript_37514/m.84534 type:complete len:237 (-) Transcript_37514:87-797(-)